MLIIIQFCIEIITKDYSPPVLSILVDNSKLIFAIDTFREGLRLQRLEAESVNDGIVSAHVDGEILALDVLLTCEGATDMLPSSFSQGVDAIE